MSHVRQRVRSQRSDVIFNIFLYSFFALLLLLVLYPLWFIVIASLSDPSAVASGHVWVLPVGFTLDGYEELLKQTNVWDAYVAQLNAMGLEEMNAIYLGAYARYQQAQ